MLMLRLFAWLFLFAGIIAFVLMLTGGDTVLLGTAVGCGAAAVVLLALGEIIDLLTDIRNALETGLLTEESATKPETPAPVSDASA